MSIKGILCISGKLGYDYIGINKRSGIPSGSTVTVLTESDIDELRKAVGDLDNYFTAESAKDTIISIIDPEAK